MPRLRRGRFAGIRLFGAESGDRIASGGFLGRNDPADQSQDDAKKHQDPGREGRQESGDALLTGQGAQDLIAEILRLEAPMARRIPISFLRSRTLI